MLVTSKVADAEYLNLKNNNNKIKVWRVSPFTITFQMEALIKIDCQRIKDLHFIPKSCYLSSTKLTTQQQQQQQK